MVAVARRLAALAREVVRTKWSPLPHDESRCTMTTKQPRRPASEQAVRLTPRDDALLDLLIRYHAVTVPMLMNTVCFGLDRSGVYRRLSRLVRIGLLEDLRAGASNVGRPRDVHALYVPTRSAYDYRDSTLTPQPVALTHVRHTLAVGEVGLAHEREGFEIVSDRQVRREIALWRGSQSHTTPSGALWLGSDQRPVGMGLGSHLEGRISTHAPDLVLVRDGAVWAAVEVELTAKSDRDLAKVLRMYGRSTRFQNLIYYIPDAKVEQQVTRVAGSLAHQETPVGLVVRRYLPRHSSE